MPRTARTWLLCGVLALGAVAVLSFMRPTLVAPVAGDDRALLPTMASYPSWTPISEVSALPETWQQRSENGRVSVLSPFERRIAARWVIDGSVRTGKATYLVYGALKLVLSVASVLAMAALVKSLRWRRRRDGRLVRASGRTVLLCTLSGAVLFALGSQPQFLARNGRNGWVNYPTHTYGAVVSIFGVVALVLWLTRLYAERRYRVVVVVTLALLAALTNFRYELTFVAVPLSVLALILVPLTPGDRVSEGRRAKGVAVLAYAGVFLPIFVILRWYLRAKCSEGACYEGVTPRLSVDMLPTLWFNLVSAIPGAGSGQAMDYVASSGTSTAGMYTPTAASLLVGVGMGIALVSCWFMSVRRSPVETATSDLDKEDGAQRRDEAPLLAIGAVLCLLGWVGAAVLMSLSTAAQHGVTDVGLLYRHTVVAWAGTAWAVALAAVALARWQSRVGAAAWLALAAATAVLAAVQMPANQRSLEADRKVNGASAAAFAALVRGDLSSSADARRCEILRKIHQESSVSADPAMIPAFDGAFVRYWGHKFCEESPSPAPGASGDRLGRESVTLATAGLRRAPSPRPG